MASFRKAKYSEIVNLNKQMASQISSSVATRLLPLDSRSSNKFSSSSSSKIISYHRRWTSGRGSSAARILSMGHLEGNTIRTQTVLHRAGKAHEIASITWLNQRWANRCCTPRSRINQEVKIKPCSAIRSTCRLIHTHQLFESVTRLRKIAMGWALWTWPHHRIRNEEVPWCLQSSKRL